MAELVQRHIESMKEEILEMRRTKLYTEEETRLILKTRKEFEYKINGISKKKEDFNKYIIYEKVLLKQIQKRREKNKIAERKSGIEYKILKRINNLYEIALQRFPGDISLYLGYLKFCKKSNYMSCASVAVQNMIKNCAQDPEVFKVAADWHAQDRNDINAALNILNKGLAIHKNSQLLYKEAVKLELSTVKNSDSSANSQVCRQLETYIMFICECINDSNYLIDILNLLEVHPFTVSVQNLIIDKLLQKYSDKELVWHTLAQREKRGLHYGITSEELQKSTETCLTRCFTKYEEGLKKVSSAEKADLWSNYLDCLLEARHDNNKLPNSIKTNQLKTALEQASKEKYLTERYYIIWLELVSDEEALKILERGTSELPHSVDLWKLHLRYATMTNKSKEVDEVFAKAIDILKERSLPLWFMYIRYYVLLSRERKIDEIYSQAVKQPPEISNFLKPKYIEWIALSKGMNDARKRYQILATEKPYCKDLHVTMSKLESGEVNYDFKFWSQVHELACKQFGDGDVDVWMDRILFYLHYKKDFEKVQEIFREAVNTLSPFLIPDFKEKYSLAIPDCSTE